MFLEPVRIVAEWLAHPTYGITPIMALVPRETGQALPATVDIRDATRDRQAALDQVPDDLTGPGILVSPGEGIAQVANPGNRPNPPDVLVDVLIRIALSKRHTADAMGDTSLFFRAITRSMGKLKTTAEGEAACSRNGILVYAIPNMQLQSVFTVVKDIDVTAGLLITLQCRDIHASS